MAINASAHSGAYVNVGRSLRLRTRCEAHEVLYKSRKSSNALCTDRPGDKLWCTQARAQGYDSIQIQRGTAYYPNSRKRRSWGELIYCGDECAHQTFSESACVPVAVAKNNTPCACPQGASQLSCTGERLQGWPSATPRTSGSQPAGCQVAPSFVKNVTAASQQNKSAPNLAVLGALPKFSRRPPAHIVSAQRSTNISSIVPRLPVLGTPGEFPQWDAYLSCVYGGPLLAETYPVDLNTFEWFYDGAPFIPSIRPKEVSPSSHVPLGTAWIGHHIHNKLDHFTSFRLGGYFVQRYDANAHKWQKGVDDGVAPPGGWLEVLHSQQAHPSGAGATGRFGTWYYRARGSGVWLHVGNATRVLRGFDADALKQRKSLEALRGAGVRVVQAPVSSYMTNNRFEIVDFRHGDFGSRFGGEQKTCVGEYRSGIHAQKRCSCNSTLLATNCAGRGATLVRAKLAALREGELCGEVA